MFTPSRRVLLRMGRAKMTQGSFDVFIHGEAVDLVGLTEELVATTNWYRWFNDEKNMEYMQQHYYPASEASQLSYLRERILGDPCHLQLGIIHKSDGIMIGTLGLSSIDFLHRKCEISGFVGETAYQKLIYFVEANQLIIKHAFDELNMNRLYGGTINRDVATLMCRMLGFKEEGVRKSDVYKGAKYHDVYLLALLREDYYAGEGPEAPA